MIRKKYFKLQSTLLLIIILLMSIVSGCQPTSQPSDVTSKQSAGESEEPINMLYLFPGDVKKDEQMVMDALNAKMAADGVPINISREPLPWDVYFEKINIKLLSNEEFDMFHIMQDLTPYNNYYSRGALADLTELISQHGPVIKNKIPQDMLDGSAIGGKNYIIPTFWVELAVENYIPYRIDVLEKYNLEIPKTPDDILDCFRTVRADWDGVNLPIINHPNVTYDAATLKTNRLHRTYDRYPFIIKDSFFMIFQDGKVESWFESEEFKKDCNFMNTAYKEGIIQTDIMSVTHDWAKNYDTHGDTFMWTTSDYEEVLKNNPDVTLDSVDSFLLAPEKPVLRSWGVKNCNGVSVTSKHPEGPVMFINWLWTSQENYDLYMYGIEDTHWKRDPSDERGVVYIKDSTTNDLSYLAGGNSWIGNIEMARYGTGMWNYVNKGYFTVNPKAVNSVAGNFFFDASKVATEYANVQAEAAVVMAPIVMGVKSYQENFDDAIAKLKVAGLDKLITEYQKQLSEFIDAK